MELKACDGAEGKRLGESVYMDTIGWIRGLVEVAPCLEV